MFTVFVIILALIFIEPILTGLGMLAGMVFGLIVLSIPVWIVLFMINHWNV